MDCTQASDMSRTSEGAQFTQHRATVTSHQTIGNEDGAAMFFLL